MATDSKYASDNALTGSPRHVFDLPEPDARTHAHGVREYAPDNVQPHARPGAG